MARDRKPLYETNPLPPEEEEALIKDAAALAMPMLKAIQKMAKERNQPAHELLDAAYQGFLQIGHILLEERYPKET